MAPVVFGIVGGGWRTEFFLRVVRALPERFAVAGVVVRDAEKGRAFERAWGVPTVRSHDDLLRLPGQRFALVSVPWPATPQITLELTARGVPVLAETPPAPNLEGLVALHRQLPPGARVQVAEQYAFQPFHAARIALARSGKLGTVSQAQVSAAHGYHGVSLIRRLLGLGFESPTITARRFSSPLVKSPDRNGPPERDELGASRQTIAWLDFGERLGVFDFTDSQYFSWVRSQRMLVRGERGEINNMELRYLADFRTPITLELRRDSAGENGNLEGMYLKGILAGSEWAYRNPFAPARLSDDEIAIATCLDRMAAYVDGGPDCYSLAEASQDHYLSMLIDQAGLKGERIGGAVA